MKYVIPALVALIGIGSAQAAEIELPGGLSFCSERAEIDEKLGEVNELTDEMLETTLKMWGLDGVIRVVLEDQRLVTARFRAYETPDSVKAIHRKLTKAYGAPATTTGTADDTGVARRLQWTPSDSVSVEMSRQTEQVYATWEISFERCADAVENQEGLTDAEKADLKALEEKKAIEFDPFSDDLDEREKEIAEEKKRKEEEKRKKEREEAGEPEKDDEDIEIDW